MFQLHSSDFLKTKKLALVELKLPSKILLHSLLLMLSWKQCNNAKIWNITQLKFEMDIYRSQCKGQFLHVCSKQGLHILNRWSCGLKLIYLCVAWMYWDHLIAWTSEHSGLHTGQPLGGDNLHHCECPRFPGGGGGTWLLNYCSVTFVFVGTLF